jgi:uncharacterized protein (TIGR03083 family)
MIQPTEPIFVVDLFPGLHQELIDLLRGLREDDWSRPTVAPRWRVRDVAAHLLDVSLRRLSVQRDGVALVPPEPIRDYGDLVRFLDLLNAQWVEAARRISPRVLVDLLAWTGPQVAALLASLDPFAPALYSVAWAGEEVSPNWFDIAREYTEHWHHQAQIRDAVGAPGLDSRKWLHPMLDTSLRALPHTYRGVAAEEGSAMVLEVTGEAGGVWSLVRRNAAWELFSGEAGGAACRIALSDDTAWRLLYNALAPEETRSRVAVSGEPALAEPLLRTRSVMVSLPESS